MVDVDNINFFKIAELIMNIVTPPERVIGTLSERTPVSIGKKLGFKPPIKKADISAAKLSGTIKSDNQSIKISTQGEKVSHNKIKLNQSKASSAKVKKKNKIEYYRNLKNYLLDPSKNEKLQLWRKNDNQESFMTNSPVRSKVGDVEMNGVSNEKQSSRVNSMSLDDFSTENASSSLTVEKPQSQVFKRPARRNPWLKPAKNRMKCGIRSCTPCSITIDCGICLQCVHKKTKK